MQSNSLTASLRASKISQDNCLSDGGGMEENAPENFLKERESVTIDDRFEYMKHISSDKKKFKKKP